MSLDWKKDLKEFYAASAKQPAIVRVPAFNFLMVDGRGDPNTAVAYREALEALYSLSYTLKFTFKKQPGGPDFAVRPLEGLWWADDMRDFGGRKDDWQWTAMIAQPDVVTEDHVRLAAEDVRRKKSPAALDQVRFERWEEGEAAQILHIGPFAAEGPTIERVHAFILDSGYRLAGKHHEIYLSDPRRTEPDKWRTVIRQPFARSNE